MNGPMSAMLDRQVFYDAVRAGLFGGRLTEGQFRGIEAILDEWRRRALPDLRWLAYILATAFHETGAKMLPGEENLNYTSAERIRQVWPSRFRSVAEAAPYVRNPQGLAEKVYGGRGDLGNNLPGDGWRFRGRGLPHVTGRRNYGLFSGRLGVDLLADPGRAMEPGIAVAILFDGMIDGVFTGAKLGDYLTGSGVDFLNARRIVNRMDRAAEIAGYAQQFHSALVAAQEARDGWTDRPAPRTPPDMEPPPAGSPGAGKGNLLARLIAALVAAVAGAWRALTSWNRKE